MESNEDAAQTEMELGNVAESIPPSYEATIGVTEDEGGVTEVEGGVTEVEGGVAEVEVGVTEVEEGVREAEETDPMLNGAVEGAPDQERVTAASNGDCIEVNCETKVDLPDGRVEITAVPREVTSAKCEKPPSSSCLSWETTRKVLIGLAIGLGVAISWVVATQFFKSMYSPNFDAPFFTIWFTTIWMLVCYPIYVAGAMILFKERREAGFRALLKEDQAIYGPPDLSWGLTLWHTLRLTGPFCALWIVTNYMYIAALKLKAPTDVTALFVTNTAFIYVFSWIWLEELLILLPARVFSVILSIVGTVLMMYGDGFGGGNVVGVLLALGSAIGAALYKVLFKRFLGDATYGQVSLFLTVLAILNLVCLWPIVLILYYTNVELIDWDNLPWAFLCGSSMLSIVFNFLVNFGIAVTYPLLISLANVVGIPINAVVDKAFRGLDLGTFKIIGALLIIGGFVVMLLPETWQKRAACWKEDSPPCHRCRRPAERLSDEENAATEVAVTV